MMSKLQDTLVRFPLALVACAAFTVFTFGDGDDPFWVVSRRVTAILVACVFFFVGLRLFTESRQTAFMNRTMEWIVGLVVAAGLLFYADAFDFSALSAFIVAFIAFAMIAPFIGAKFDHKAMWFFLCRVGLGFVFSGFVVLVLIAGIGLIILSLDYLFDVKNVHSFWRIMVVSCSLIWPMLTMMQIPKDFSAHADATFVARLRSVGDYLLPSLWIVLAAIINAYALNIAVVQSLPRGKVSVLVLLLGGSGFLTYFLGDSGEESSALPNRILRKVFGFLMIAPLMLMGVGIAERIEGYGLTEWRYLNVLVLVAMSIGVIYFLVRRKDKMIRVVLATVCILSLLSTIPPVSALELSVASQREQLKSILESNEVLVGKRIRVDHPPLPPKENGRVIDGLLFLQSRNRFSAIRDWFEKGDNLVTAVDFAKAMNVPFVGWHPFTDLHPK